MTFSRVGEIYKYLVPERKELGVGEVEDVGKRGQTEGPGPGSAVGRRAQAEHRDVREREKRGRCGVESLEPTAIMSLQRREAHREEASHLHVAPQSPPGHLAMLPSSPSCCPPCPPLTSSSCQQTEIDSLVGLSLASKNYQGKPSDRWPCPFRGSGSGLSVHPLPPLSTPPCLAECLTHGR